MTKKVCDWFLIEHGITPIMCTVAALMMNCLSSSLLCETHALLPHLMPFCLFLQVVICGGPTMSIACLFSLQQLGFPPQAIYIYGQFGVEQVKAVYGRTAKLSGHDCHTKL